MDKRKITVVIFAIVVALIVSFIFSNSLKTREESVKDSDAVVGILGPLLKRIFGDNAERISFIVRKLAHFTEFAMLGFAITALVVAIGSGVKWPLCCFGLAFCLVIAITDELIQKFVGRGSAVRDVMIDFCGALFATLVIVAAIKIKKIVKKINIPKEEKI